MKTSKTPSLEIDSLSLKKAALHYRAINHHLRQQIMQLLHKNGRLMVTTIYVKLRIEQSVASQHLAILRRAKLVNAERVGKKVFYSVNYRNLEQLHAMAAQLLRK
jgi:DNA-binding transcriptional ArsR family regulator